MSVLHILAPAVHRKGFLKIFLRELFSYVIINVQMLTVRDV